MKNLAMQRRGLVAVFVSVVATFSLVGCSAPTLLVGDAEEDLQQRARAYWALIRANDKVAAWKYEIASKDRSLLLEAYLKQGGIAYEAVEVRSVRSYGADEAEVDVWMRYDLPLIRIKGQELLMQDRWRRVDGVWYHAPKRSVIFPGSK